MTTSTKSINKYFKKDIYMILDQFHDLERKKLRDRIINKRVNATDRACVLLLQKLESVIVKALTSAGKLNANIRQRAERFVKRFHNFVEQLLKNFSFKKTLSRGYVSHILTDFTIMMNAIINSNSSIDIDNDELAQVFQLTVFIWGDGVRFRMK